MANADRPTTHLVKPAELKKGDYVMIKGNPCYIIDITAKVKGTGEHSLHARKPCTMCMCTMHNMRPRLASVLGQAVTLLINGVRECDSAI